MAKVENFRFWCQKVLPLVYDDSLSYYELLCKMVTYLNNTINAVNENTDDVTSMRTELTEFEGTVDNRVDQLEAFMNNYFENLDVQNEINNKLDAMAQSGELNEIIAPFIPDIVSDWLSEHITPTTPAIDDSLTVSGAGADAKVVGDLFKTTLKSMSSIEVDLDNYMDAGYYVLDVAVLYTNCPVANNTRRTLVVIQREGQRQQWLFATTGVNSIYVRNYADNEWKTWYKLYNDAVRDVAADNIVSSDLNNATDVGYYILKTNVNYANCPVGINIRRTLEVFVHGGVVAQYLYATNGTNKVYARWYADNTWNDWSELYDSAFQWRDNATITNNDLDNATTIGYYVLGYSTLYTHSPVTWSERKVLWVTKGGTQLQQFLYTLQNSHDIYTRFYTVASGWSEWTKQIAKEDNILVENIVGSEAHISSEKIAEIDIMSYNVANWNKDTSTYITDDKIHNVRSMLNDYPVDFHCLQEDKQYIDNSSKLPLDYIFRNSIAKSGGGGTTIYENVAHDSAVILDMAGGNSRTVRVAYYTIASKKVALLNLHATSHVGNTDKTSAENIALRATELTSVHGFINGTNTLKDRSTQEDVSFADNVDYVIICGDFNTITVTDRTNIQTIFSDMKMLNGGWLGWLKTVPVSGFTCDNIIVSSNVGVKSFKVLNSWYDALYSDHVPIVAKLTLN